MPLPVFLPRITYGNQAALPAGLGVVAPAGLPSQAMLLPNYVSAAELVRRRSSIQDFSSGQFSLTRALVEPVYTISFANMRWEPVSDSRVRFLEGEVHLQLNLTIYMDMNYQHNSQNRFVLRMFAEIMSHELEHMLDEIDLITNYMPEYLARHHVTAQCFGRELTTLRRDYFIQSGGYLQQTRNAWILEHSRRADRRHEHRSHRARLDRLQRLSRQSQ